MGRLYRPRKVDANQSSVVDYLRGKGCVVKLLHEAGSGVPDLLVGFMGVTFLIETKVNKNKNSIRVEYTDKQVEFYATWTGQPVIIAISGKHAWQQLNKQMKRLAKHLQDMT